MSPQRNTPERKATLIERRTRQEAREYGFWGSAGQPFYPLQRPKLIPASINRRTGKPHLHERACLQRTMPEGTRRQRQWLAAPPPCAPSPREGPADMPSFDLGQSVMTRVTACILILCAAGLVAVVAICGWLT